MNFTLQHNKFHVDNPEKESLYNGYVKLASGEKVYLIKIWERMGKFGKFLSGSIELDKIEKAKEEAGTIPASPKPTQRNIRREDSVINPEELPI